MSTRAPRRRGWSVPPSPTDRRRAWMQFSQQTVGLREVPAAEEGLWRTPCRERRRMVGGEHAMAALVDEVALLLSRGAPEQEHDRLLLRSHVREQRVGEPLPPASRVALRLAALHRERG